MKYVPRRLARTADISRGERRRGEALAEAVPILVFLVLAYLALGLVADVVAARVPSSWEGKVSWSVGTPDSGALTWPQIILDRLLVHAPVRELPYRLVLLDSPEPNAFAMPGGTIGVTTGLLDGVEGELGLAMVLAHELGHHDARHVLKRLGRVLLVTLPFVLVSGEVGEFVNRFLMFGELSYSREQEREADQIGLRLVYAAYGDTSGALEFFEMIQAKEGDGGRWSRLLESHPPTVERIEALKKLARELEAG